MPRKSKGSCSLLPLGRADVFRPLPLAAVAPAEEGLGRRSPCPTASSITATPISDEVS
jgi:hypothetical protein